MRPKCYISGPITGLDPVVYIGRFYKLSREVEKLGFAAINPVELVHDHDQSWASFMRNDIKAMMDCDAICLMRGWHKSAGAKMEYYIAQMLQMRVLLQEEMDNPHLYYTEEDSMDFDMWENDPGGFIQAFGTCSQCMLPDSCHDNGCAINIGQQVQNL